MKERTVPIWLLIAIAQIIMFGFHAETSLAVNTDIWDSWTTAGDNIDDTVFIDTFPPTYFSVVGVASPGFTPMVYCVNRDEFTNANYEFCIARNSANRTACSGVVPVPAVLDTTGGSTWYSASNVDLFVDIGSGGNTFFQQQKNRTDPAIEVFCDKGAGCESCETSGFGTIEFIDEMFQECDGDASVGFDTRGYYGVGQSISIESFTCSGDNVCDALEDDAETSDSPIFLPGSPCRDPNGGSCVDFDSCWHNLTCSGGKERYSGTCDGSDIDIYFRQYENSCGGLGLLDNSTLDSNDADCNIDGGFPVGFECDDTLDGFEYTLESGVFNAVCKGGIGNGCSVDSDCLSELECENSFCSFGMTAVFLDNDTDNKINKGGTITYDNSLSISSDSNITYACYYKNNILQECDGIVSHCNAVCPGANDNINWDNGFIETFISGGDFTIKLLSGHYDLYNDTYSEDYCVSGDGNFCFSCSDNIKNDDETDVDWGGHCGTPYFVKCNNGLLDNVTNESSVDYGGDCGQCDNTNVNEDLNLQLLKNTGRIIYPFTLDQCDESQSIVTGIVTFVLIISAVLIVPVIFFIVILLVLILVLGTGVLGGFLAGTRERFSKKKKKK